MTESYAPTSRRPIADLFRRTASVAVRVCLRLGIHPDAISYASVAVSAAAAVCFYEAAGHRWLLLIGPLFCFVRLWFNMLDGMVAIASGRASRRGEILNDLPDRFSDVIVFTAVAQSGLCHAPLGYWAAIAAVLTAYVGTLAQAVGAPRQFGGLMSKPWRMVALAVGAWTQYFIPAPPRFSPLDVACVVILAGCAQTIIVRLIRTLAALSDR